MYGDGDLPVAFAKVFLKNMQDMQVGFDILQLPLFL